MGQDVLVMGGTRFFGKLLVWRLLEAGHQVTIATRGRATDDFGHGVRRIRVDRRDEMAVREAFAGVGGFDIVFDQMCYSPQDAAISIRTFAGKVGRYVMSSTIETYEHLQGRLKRPFLETDVDLEHVAVALNRPWHHSGWADRHYGLGKRQAEACFHQDGRLPVVAVRIAHVLAGPEDFTGRLADYVRKVVNAEAVRHSTELGATSFIHSDGIADFLCWVGQQSFLGPINGASDGELTALDIYRRVGDLLGKPVESLAMARPTRASELSPFDYPFPYAMDTSRAKSMGYHFDHSREWLDGLIFQHAAAASNP